MDIRPLTPDTLDALGAVLTGSWGSTCWCMFPRQTDAQARAQQGTGTPAERRREAMAELAHRTPAPGLLAIDGDTPVGWVAVAPRADLGRVAGSRATPPVDEQPVWVIPCITVHRRARGRGTAVALIRAAAAYALRNGAPAVEAYPRAGGQRIADGNAYLGTERMFRRAGFHVIRPPLDGVPRTWIRRVTMRFPPAAGTGQSSQAGCTTMPSSSLVT